MALSGSSKLLLDQPVHRFFARLEGGQFPPGEALNVLVKHFGETVGPDPCGALEVWPVKHCALLQAVDGDAVKRCPGEVGKQQHRSVRLAGYIRGNEPRHLLQFNGGAVRSVHQKNLLALLLDVANAVFHESLLSTRVAPPSRRLGANLSCRSPERSRGRNRMDHVKPSEVIPNLQPLGRTASWERGSSDSPEFQPRRGAYDSPARKCRVGVKDSTESRRDGTNSQAHPSAPALALPT